MHIVITGGTGFIGRKLTSDLLAAGHSVIVPSRKPEKGRFLIQNGYSRDVSFVEWDGKSPDALIRHLEPADAVINLAGENIAAGRWDQRQKDRIVNSRIHTGEALVAAISGLDKKPEVFIQASAVGFYGGSDETVDSTLFSEHALNGKGFLADTAVKWEQSTAPLDTMGIRRVILRTGMVLGSDGGALPKFITPFKFYFGGPLGSGRQMVSWIDRDDACAAILHLLSCPHCQGPYNLTAPSPVTMQEFCATLGKVMRKPSWAPVPAFALRLLLGEMAQELILQGQNAVPSRLLESGFHFTYPLLEQSLSKIINKST